MRRNVEARGILPMTVLHFLQEKEQTPWDKEVERAISLRLSRKLSTLPVHVNLTLLRTCTSLFSD